MSNPERKAHQISGSKMSKSNKVLQGDNKDPNNFTDWYNKNMQRVEYLNQLITSDVEISETPREDYHIHHVVKAKKRSRSGREIFAKDQFEIGDVSTIELREKLKMTNAKLKKIYHENELMREVMRQATDYSNMQLMSAEVKTLQAERDKLRQSLSKVIEIEDKIVQYKRQAEKSKFFEKQVGKLQNDLKTINEKMSKNEGDLKKQLNEMEFQLKIVQKERNEYRSKAEKLEFQYNLAKFELDKKFKGRELSQTPSRDCVSFER